MPVLSLYKVPLEARRRFCPAISRLLFEIKLNASDSGSVLSQVIQEEHPMKLTNTKRRFSTIGWLFAFTATVGATVSIAPAQAGLLGVSEKEEIEAGRQVAVQARQEYGGSLPANNPMSIRVRALGQKFARLSTRKNIPYSYEVLNNDKVLNAFAAPGGPVFVTRKLVQTTSNDAELAYVLGHETGHIEKMHIVKRWSASRKSALASAFSARFSAAAMAPTFSAFSVT
jgi:predicted Zn-dependent protease